MIRNYILTALRNLWRNKLITSINVIGMAIGFGIFITFWSWMDFDLSFDQFHDDYESIYNLKVRFTMDGAGYTADRTGGAFAADLRDHFPSIESSCRVSDPQSFELGIRTSDCPEEANMRYYDEDEVICVDSSFFDFFSFPLLEGDKRSLLRNRDHILLSESLAKKLFGNRSALGEQIRIGEGGYFSVAGIMEDPPENSSIQYKAILGFHIMEEQGYPVDGYGGTMFYTFFRLSETTNLKTLNTDINTFVEARFESDLESTYFLDPFSRLHLHGEHKGSIGVYMNLIMSLLILSIACINFINLSTAYASGRLKEISIRKSAGASKRQLIIQFLGETYILLLLSLYLGIFLAEHLVPLTGRLFDAPVLDLPSKFTFWIQVTGVYFITGLLAGLYPAFKVAEFKSLSFFHSRGQFEYKGGRRSRKVLVVTQFTFSIIFIIVAVFQIRQIDYLREADLGFNREEVIYIPVKGKVWDKYPLIKEELKRAHFVKDVSSGSEIPVKVDHGDIEWGERDGEHNKLARILFTDSDFLSAFDIELEEGRFFDRNAESVNHNYVVVNRALVDLMGWEDPVGRSFFMWGRDLEILGVIENIKFFPFNIKAISSEALILRYEDVSDFVFVRVEPELTQEHITAIQQIFLTYNPEYEFSYDFVSNYEYEALEGSDGLKFLFRFFSALGIFISVLGLIGLSIYNSNRRIKEVGIRKAMGAHSGIIMRLLLSEFIKLVLLSNLIAVPLSYLLVKKIMQFFNYRVDLSGWVFVYVAAISIILSMATVIYHAYRTARSNPIKSLRYE